MDWKIILAGFGLQIGLYSLALWMAVLLWNGIGWILKKIKEYRM